MKTIKYLIAGQQPYDNRVNAMLRAFDLGMTGAYIPDSHHIVTVTLKPGTTDEQIQRQPAAIREAYEELGWVNVRVRLWEMG